MKSSSEAAKLMVQLLLIAPQGSWIWYDEQKHELVLVLPENAWEERRAAV